MINIVEKKPAELKGYTLVEGFPGMGLVGTIAVNYLVEKLGFESYGYIESDFFLPIVRVHHGVPRHPSVIYINNKHKLLVLASEQIIPKSAAQPLARTIVEWARKRGIKRIISLEGIHTPKKGKADIVYGIACSEKAKKELLKYGVKLVDEGITSGVTSMILLELTKYNDVIGYSLLGNVVVLEDYRAAAICLNKLATILNLKIDTKPLLKEAKHLESMLLKQLKQLKEVHENVRKFEERSHPLMYT
jgi:uncharacterized protein